MLLIDYIDYTYRKNGILKSKWNRSQSCTENNLETERSGYYLHYSGSHIISSKLVYGGMVSDYFQYVMGNE